MVLNGPMNLSKSVNLLCDLLINSICFDLLLESMISNKKSKARGLFTYFYIVLQITAGAAAKCIWREKCKSPSQSFLSLQLSVLFMCFVLSYFVSSESLTKVPSNHIQNELHPLPAKWGTFKGDFQDFTTLHRRKEIVLPFLLRLIRGITQKYHSNG